MVLVRPGWRAAAVSVSLLTALSTVGLAPAATADQQSQRSGSGMRVVATKLDNPMIKAVRFNGDPSEREWLNLPDPCGAPPLLVVEL